MAVATTYATPASKPPDSWEARLDSTAKLPGQVRSPLPTHRSKRPQVHRNLFDLHTIPVFDCVIKTFLITKRRVKLTMLYHTGQLRLHMSHTAADISNILDVSSQKSRALICCKPLQPQTVKLINAQKIGSKCTVSQLLLASENFLVV